MFRNKEFRLFALLFLALSVGFILIGFAISPAAGVLALVSSVVFGTAFFVFTKSRYRKIAQMSKQIDRILHNADRLELDDFCEGELSILHSEISKMTLRIREQNDTLKKDKQYLADSLADIAHQLRTPLTSANLILSFLSKNPKEDERQAFLRELTGATKRMDWLITSLLKISRLDAGVVEFQSEPVGVKMLIESALRPLAIPMELHGITVSLAVGEACFLCGDFGWLSEAIQNILKNCMESVNENGSIKVACNETVLYTEIVIHDSGAGFLEEDVNRLFDRFYRGKSANAGGYGIGLALSKMILVRQGGFVTAKNHPQGGAVFSIRFPVTSK
ncbi:two-component sensor histidine kinase [Clostridia bacterium]|nr:two-component sensor histidine kinase [Clostridia bacterium]